MIRVQGRGYQIGDDLVITPPKEVWLPWPRALDGEIIEGIFDVLSNEALGDRGLAHRIGLSIDWLAHSWRNSPSISPQLRVVLLRTGFEALAGTSSTGEIGVWLEQRYDDLRALDPEDEDVDHLLWSSAETPNRVRTWSEGQSQMCTDLVHWFGAFSDTRNDIIHDGGSDALTYDEEGSAYNGPFPNIAERLLRETIRVSFRQFGYDDLWQDACHRAIKRALEQAMEEE